MSTNYINKITDTAGTTHDIQEGVDTRLFRATCPTAAATAAKVATLDDATNYTLAAGVRVAVTFTYGNSATTPTLNVNSGGAKNIVVPTAVATLTSGNGTTYNTWGPYETIIFTYNGSQWVQSGSAYSIYNAYALANSKTANTITLNGSTNASPTFYAPTGAGTSGQYLKSNGSGAPSWTNFPTIPAITLNGSSTTSPSFYAPTSVGTSGQYLKSNGSGAPTWVTPPSSTLVQIVRW